MLGLNYVVGLPRLSGCIRALLEDFIVLEELGFAPPRSGEHIFLGSVAEVLVQ